MYNRVKQCTTKDDLSKDTIMYNKCITVYKKVCNSVKQCRTKGGVHKSGHKCTVKCTLVYICVHSIDGGGGGGGGGGSCVLSKWQI